MSRVGPSRANLSFNSDLVIVHLFHDDLCDEPQVANTDVVRSDAFRFDMQAAHDERPTHPLGLAHEQQFTARN